ncbi:MAG: hypothetical protein COU63_01915 [Candidatus Pacebacteria bacterium CG10_big_fil_rev_8_21_14_0_10_36_11]|nr:hypothetical protein [Candidatus Pacearchaeota archaeon]OIP73664.1 MAG: hypothetical protein AUK08_03810 [Candidatus Pacebacteria bacterium CG2_30_36_39]PIR64754.1 MAG: hypothetical protein COU63_01915 [Candidatus Pacebacteria bacterium CG10_big_fil_rev_8_21_14_0_10_36_11]PJC43054.1 MAG: hypothetical protein CO040_01175 [Candidatus Pacebacteria bacterium CG_4_9_14_0_2_um_filter_36_8]
MKATKKTYQPTQVANKNKLINWLLIIKRFLTTNSNGFLSGLLIWHLILRIPTFFEPFWYVDETLYILMGKAIKDGAILYRDVVDNKPPIVYLLATIIPSQLGLRILNTIFISITLICFYDIINRLIVKKNIIAKISTITLMILLSFPTFEGTIFNAEPVYITFGIIGIWLLSKTNSWKFALEKNTPINKTKSENKKRFLAGIFFGLALLTKIPALLFFGPIILTDALALISQNKTTKNIKQIIVQFSLLIIGLLLPVIITTCFFAYHQTLTEYSYWTFKYLFGYIENWKPFFDFSPSWLKIFFLTKTKLISFVLSNLLLLKLYSKQKISLRRYLLFSWTIASLYSVILSNRPFNNYWLPFWPSMIALTSYVIEKMITKYKSKSLYFGWLISVFITIFIFVAIPFKLFPSVEYYQLSWKLFGGKITKWDYESWFDKLVDESVNPRAPTIMGDNKITRDWLNKNKITTIFIWGNNPMVLLGTNAKQITRFPLSFYIDHLQQFNDQQFAQSYQEIVDIRPEVIIKMKPTQSKFFEMDKLIEKYYQKIIDMRTQTIYFSNDATIFELSPTTYYSRFYLISQILNNQYPRIKTPPSPWDYPRNDSDLFQLSPARNP